MNLSMHLLQPFCLVEESGFSNNWKRSEGRRGGQLIQRVSYLNTEAVSDDDDDGDESLSVQP